MRPCSLHNQDRTLFLLLNKGSAPFHCKDSSDEPVKQLLKKTKQAPDQEKQRRLYCGACKHPITSVDQRMEVQGAHEHTCTNPQEVNYRIGCFKQAPGCASIGEPTDEFTWFTGYSWQITLCGSCGLHLGWLFQTSGASGFYGLILAQLVSEH